MPHQWNPSSPRVRGVEWLPYLAGSVSLDRQDTCVAMSMEQTASETIGEIRVLVTEVPTPGGYYTLEVYDNESAVPTAPFVNRVTPNADVSGTGTFSTTWRNQLNSGTAIYQAVDDTTLNTSDYIHIDNARAGTPYVFRIANAVTTDRPLAVTLGVVAKLGYAAAAASLRFGLRIDGINYLGPTGFGRLNRQWQTYTYTWRINPATQKAWRASEIQALSTTDALFIEPSATAANREARIAQIFVDTNLTAENRLARGTTRIDAPGWVSFTMTTPSGGAWTKDGADRHLYTLRKVTPLGRIVVPTLTGDAAPPNATGYSPKLDPNLFHVTDMGAPKPTVFGMLQRTTAPAISDDSQPYGLLGTATTHTSATIATTQSFTGVAEPFGSVRFLVRPGNDLPANNPLTVELRRSSDNYLMGSATLTRTAARSLPDLGDGWRMARVSFTSPPTLTAASYYLRFVGGPDMVQRREPPIDGFWQLRYIAAGTVNIAPQGATEAGVAQTLTVESTPVAGGTLPFQLYLGPGGTGTPPYPGMFAATVLTQTVTPTPLSGIDGHEFVELTWAPTSVGTRFAYYEVQRNDGGDWTTIRRVRTEASSVARDYEAARGVESSYRIRVLTTEGAASAWSGTVTATPQARGQVIALVSNHDPTLNVLVEPGSDAITYEFLRAGDLATVAVYGRDHQLAYQPTEDRGVSVSFSVVAGVSEPDVTAGGLDRFAQLRTIATAPLPYVCVLDPRGPRVYAVLSVPSGTDTRAAIQIAEVNAVSVTDTPFPKDDNPIAPIY